MSVAFAENGFSQKLPAVIFSCDLPDIMLTCTGSTVGVSIKLGEDELCTLQLDVVDGQTALYNLREIVESELERRAAAFVDLVPDDFMDANAPGQTAAPAADRVLVKFREPNALEHIFISSFVVYSTTRINSPAADFIRGSFLTSGNAKQIAADGFDTLPYIATPEEDYMQTLVRLAVLYRSEQGEIETMHHDNLGCVTEQMQLRYWPVDVEGILEKCRVINSQVSRLLSIVVSVGGRSITYFVSDQIDLQLCCINQFGCKETIALRGQVSHSQKSESQRAVCSRRQMAYNRKTSPALVYDSAGVLPQEVGVIEQLARTIGCTDTAGNSLIATDSEISDDRDLGACATAKIEFDYADDVAISNGITGTAGRIHTSHFTKEYS